MKISGQCILFYSLVAIVLRSSCILGPTSLREFVRTSALPQRSAFIPHVCSSVSDSLLPIEPELPCSQERKFICRIIDLHLMFLMGRSSFTE